jgi:dienelactone hydrolase
MKRVDMLLLGGAIVMIAGIAIGVRVHKRWSAPSADQEMAPEEDEDAGIAAWCADGLSPVNGNGCFASPPGSAKDTPLILYLHGIYDQRADADEMDRQRRLAKFATQRGFAVLALRGLEGGCSPEPEFATKWCWPSNERTAARAPETVGEWKPALRAAARAGAGGRRYVLGFSNGGFFAGLLAVRALFDADAFVVGNAGPVEPVHALGTKPPLLLMSADDDASQDGMMRLDDELTREGWLHENYARAGTHELTDDEIDAALTFFVRLRSEKLPFSTPLSSHRPRAREARPPEEAEGAALPQASSGRFAPDAGEHEPAVVPTVPTIDDSSPSR